MKINQAFKYELKPNNKHIGVFVKSCGVARFAWNWGLARRIELYKTEQGKERFTSSINQQRELNVLKKPEFPWMYDVSKSIPQSALNDLEEAYTYYYRGLKKHGKVGKPKFKKKGEQDNCRFSQYNETIKIWDKMIRLPRIGWVRTKEPTDKFMGRILNATVSREADRWFCSLAVEVDRPTPSQVVGDIIGIDLGINCFATISNGKATEDKQSPKPLRKYLKKLARLSQCQDKKQSGSNNEKKAGIKLAKLHLRIKNIRKDYLSQLSSELAKTKSMICLEDLNISGMLRNHRLARSVGDEGWGMFRRMLEYKTKWYGSQLVVIPRFEPTSKRCNNCGEINHDLKLSDRTWVCLNCGVINERDSNAACNIRDKGIELLDTDSLSEFQACGVDVRPSRLMAVDCESGNKLICYK